MTYDSRPDTLEHIVEVQDRLLHVISCLLQRAQEHDQSKLLEPELSTFNEYTPRLRESAYGSDEYKGFLKGMGKGLAHHYAANTHHPEHYSAGIRGMSLLDLVEMLCDWEAATLRHTNGDIHRSIDQNQERFGYSDDLKAVFHNTIHELHQ
jgi:Family of unknown function (DUF5662)